MLMKWKGYLSRLNSSMARLQYKVGKRHPGDDEHLREYDVSICKVVVVAEYFWRNL
jgi:hypothetical protein